MLALHVRIGNVGLQDVRQHVQRNHDGPRIDDVPFKKQEGHGRGKEHQPRQPEEEVHHGIGVADALPQREPFPQKGVVHAKDLRHAARPPDALAHVGREAFRGQTGGLRLVDVSRGVTAPVQLEGGVRILGHGFHGNAAHFQQRSAPYHRAGAAEERGVPEIIAILDQPVEQRTLVGDAAEGAQVALKRVGREEVVRCLQHRALRVALEPAHGRGQKRARGDVVAIENGDQLTIGFFERVVQVAGLGVFVVGPHDIAHAHGFGECTEFLAPPIVQDEDLDLVLGPVQYHRGQHCGAHHAQRLVVGGDIHIHRGPGCGRTLQLRRTAVQGPGRLYEALYHHQPGVGLCRQQAIAQEGLDDRVEFN